MKKSASLFALTFIALACASLVPASAQNIFTQGDILVSSSTYADNATILPVGTPLPITPAANARYSGTYYQVFNNEADTATLTIDPNFGITSPIAFTQLTPAGASTGVVINVPQSYLDTSFSSKSELGINLSAGGTAITFMAYPATANQIDLSNSATPGNDFSGDTDVAAATYRTVGQLNYDGSLTPITETVAYSGDNARNAILAGNGIYYTVGASGSSNLALAGAEAITPTPGGVANAVSLGSYPSVGSGKDSGNNFRGETIFNNTLYASKGSGGASKSVDTVYQVGTAGTLPTGTNNPITILPGFNTVTEGTNSTSGPHPFGLWFANATTLYVADEGTGVIGDIQSPTTGLPAFNGNNAYAGLEKWSLVSGTWVLDYTLTNGLNIGTNYTVSGSNGGVAGTYTTAPDGLRNIIGRVNGNGTVTIWGISSTATSENGSIAGAAYATNNAVDEGCDPNQLVSITDTLTNTTASQASSESFSVLETAAYGQVLRGVSFVPYATSPGPVASDTPTLPQWGLIGLGALLFAFAVSFLPARRLTLRS